MDLNKSIRYLKGVGPSREILFNKLGIFTLKELLYYFPRTYEDRSQTKKIIELVDGEKASIVNGSANAIENASIVTIGSQNSP